MVIKYTTNFCDKQNTKNGGRGVSLVGKVAAAQTWNLSLDSEIHEKKLGAVLYGEAEAGGSRGHWLTSLD